MTAREDLIALYESMPSEDRAAWQRRVSFSHRVGSLFEPDLVIAPDGEPYLYRWIIEKPDDANGGEYFHIQVKSDPERPLHDHPWDNASFIMAGGYEEVIDPSPWNQTDTGRKHGVGTALQSATQFVQHVKPGKFYTRMATTAHRLILPRGVTYTMTRFLLGPKLREWGFWYPDGWHHNERHVADRDGQSVHTNRCDCDGGQGSIRHHFSCPSFMGVQAYPLTSGVKNWSDADS